MGFLTSLYAWVSDNPAIKWVAGLVSVYLLWRTDRWHLRRRAKAEGKRESDARHAAASAQKTEDIRSHADETIETSTIITDRFDAIPDDELFDAAEVLPDAHYRD